MNTPKVFIWKYSPFCWSKVFPVNAESQKCLSWNHRAFASVVHSIQGSFTNAAALPQARGSSTVFTKLRNGNLRLHASAVEIFQPSESSNCATSWKIWKGSFLGMTWIIFKKIHHTTYPDPSWSFLAQFVQKDSFNAAQGSLLKASKIPATVHLFRALEMCRKDVSTSTSNCQSPWRQGRKSIKMLRCRKTMPDLLP